jgi:hypothetical protein
MKVHVTYPLAILGALLLLSSSAMAQGDESSPIRSAGERSPLSLGFTVGLNRNFHTGGFRTITADESCPVFESGGGWGFQFGASAEIAAGERSGIIPRLTYESRPGTFEYQLPDSYILPPDATEAVVQSVVANSEITYSILNAEVLYKYEIAQLGGVRLGVAAGPAFGLVLSGHNRQTQDLILPANARFNNIHNLQEENGGRRLVYFDGDVPDRNGMRLALKLGAQAETSLFGDQWAMVPGIYYDLGLSDVTEGDNWQLNTLTFSIDFRRAF